jgi:2-dehydro-3-deoxygluconokinase
VTKIRIASIGECMIELNHLDASTLALAYGGDTLNTALYLARSGPADRFSVDYVTALGDDPYSEAMLAGWQAEGIGTAQVARLPGKLPGLYIIRLDDKGERRFFYYRSAAAARFLFADDATAAQLAELPGYDLVYFSAITLSILGPPARDRLFAALGALRRRGGRVAFDSNFRPSGWPDLAIARATVERFLDVVDIALPTFDDEQKLFGDAEPAGTAARYAASAVGEVVVKLGAEGCLVAAGGGMQRVAAPPARVVDTTAAGDAFNAGYLAARLLGREPGAAALVGHRLAGTVVGHKGAIIPRAAMPQLSL